MLQHSAALRPPAATASQTWQRSPSSGQQKLSTSVLLLLLLHTPSTTTHRRRVFLLGPSHHVYTRKCVLSSAQEYTTPLGRWAPWLLVVLGQQHVYRGSFRCLSEGIELPDRQRCRVISLCVPASVPAWVCKQLGCKAVRYTSRGPVGSCRGSACRGCVLCRPPVIRQGGVQPAAGHRAV